MKLYVGIDPSLTATAVCIMAEDGKTYTSHVLKNSPLRGAARLDAMIKEFSDILKPCQGIPMLVGIEGYSYGSFAGRERLGEWGGVLRLTLFRLGFPYAEIPPTSLKKYTTGKGNAKKNLMLMAVYKTWGVEFQTDDEADSYALAQFIRTGQKLPEPKRRKL